jgi:hypothetical protein
MRNRYGFLFLMLALILNSNQLQAGTYTCNIEDKWVKNWYDIRYVQIDTERGTAKYGTPEKWERSYKTKSKKAGIGMIYSWTQDLSPKNSSKVYRFGNKLRVKKKGGFDLRMSRGVSNWDIKLDCKLG